MFFVECIRGKEINKSQGGGREIERRREAGGRRAVV
jgi:hypothetical protein